MERLEGGRMTGRSFGEALADVTAGSPSAGGPRVGSAPPGRWLGTAGRARRLPARLLALGPLGRLPRWQALALLLVLVATSGALVVYYGPASLEATPPLQTAFLYANDGHTLLGEVAAEENRVVVPLSEIPRMVRDAFVAVEDERFWSHPGIDPLAIGRALLANLRGDREGASTITQQVVKVSVVGRRRTLWRKLAEAITAIRLDRRYSKEAILEAYLNSIYLGHGAYGVEAASRLYFGKGVRDLTLAQAALLAGVTAAPQRFSPRVDPELARRRRDFALRRMHERGMITAAQLAAALREPIVLARRPARPPVRAPQFVDWVRAEILRRFGEDELYRGGLRVTTSLDLDVQRAAEEAVADVLDRPGDPGAAVVALDAATGQVLAMVGGRGRGPGEFNLATHARRQPGSAFKPFVLAAALEDGKRLSTTYRAPGSIRVRFDTGEVWRVRNYDGRGYGRLSLLSATAYSVNTVYAQLIRDVGPARVAAVARRLGITSPLAAVPSLALGTSGVTPLEMAAAYAAFVNGGEYRPPTGIVRIRDIRGRSLGAPPRPARRAISEDVAAEVRDALETVVRRGTGTPARLPGVAEQGGKTGTTEDHRDAWFVGFAGGYVVAVWVGYPDGSRTMERVHGISVTGNSFPAQIWRRVVAALLASDEGGRQPGQRSDRRSTRREVAPSPSPEPSPSSTPEGRRPSPTPRPTRRGLPLPTPLP
jgi:penicillin-binding protein 1A